MKTKVFLGKEYEPASAETTSASPPNLETKIEQPQEQIKKIEKYEKAITPEFKEENKKEEPKEGIELIEGRSEGPRKSVFREIWETITVFFKWIFGLK